MYNKINKCIGINLFLSITFFFSFLFIGINYSEAAGSYGWFAPRVDYVGPASCSSQETSIEVHLVKAKTKNLISGPNSTWNVNVVNKNTKTAVRNFSYSAGTKKSDPICFNATTQGIRVNYTGGGGDYRYYSGPVVYSTTPDTSLIGQHFIGYVELKPRSQTTPDLVTSTLANSYTPSDATFSVDLNDTDTLYGNAGVDTIKFYFSKNNIINEFDYSVVNPAVSRISTPPGYISFTEDGLYLWSMHAQLNNTANSSGWTFSKIPTSAVPATESVIIDGTAPISNISNLVVSNIVGPTTVDVSFNYTINDSNDGSGIQSYQISYSEDSGMTFQPVFSNNSVPDYTSSFSLNYTMSNLDMGKNYGFYITAVDNLGNNRTYGPYTISIPDLSSSNPPDISLDSPPYTDILTDTSKKQINAVWNDTGNPFGIDSAYVCWSSVNGDISSFKTNDITLLDTDNDGDLDNLPSGSITCENTGTDVASLNSSSYTFNRIASGLPPDTTVHFRVFAHNPVGWGMTSNSSITTTAIFTDPNNQDRVEITIDSLLPSTNFIRSAITIRKTHARNVDLYGMCWFLDVDDRNNFYPNALNTVNPNCNLFPTNNASGLSWNNNTSNVPFTANPSFLGLSPNTTYYFRAFLLNDLADLSTPATRISTEEEYSFANAQISTVVPYYHFSHYFHNTDVDRTSLGKVYLGNFDSTLGRYDNVDIKVIAYDESYNPTDQTSLVYNLNPMGSVARRSINYEARIYYGLDASNNLILKETKTGSIPATPQGGYLDIDDISFTDVPLGQYKIEVTLNPEPTSYSCAPLTSTPSPKPNCDFDKTKILLGTLYPPNSFPSDQTNSNANSTAATDPHISLTANPALIRKDRNTTLEWEMDSVAPGVFTCSFSGPMDTGVPTIFDPADPTYSSNLPSGRIGGSFDSANLASTQIFKLECTAAGTNIYSSPDTRVTVIGSQEET